MNLWLIEKADTKASEIFKTHFNPSEDKIIFFLTGHFLNSSLRQSRSICRMANDLLSLNEVKDIEEKYHQFCTQWKYQEEKDYTLIDEISYGFLNEPALHEEFHLLLLMKYGELYRKVFKLSLLLLECSTTFQMLKAKKTAMATLLPVSTKVTYWNRSWLKIKLRL